MNQVVQFDNKNPMSVFLKELKLEDIIEFKINRWNETGGLILKAKTVNRYLIKLVYPSGIVENRSIEIPIFYTKSDRDKAIKDLHRQGYKQTEIADYLDISQSTVSNVIRN